MIVAEKSTPTRVLERLYQRRAGRAHLRGICVPKWGRFGPLRVDNKFAPDCGYTFKRSVVDCIGLVILRDPDGRRETEESL
jgi:hypothetical protein